ncbi:MAG: menaquinone biosynthesis protein [Deltaproteobacteria bacterium]|nr:menaquinone biosynthesis protein [Deltaproteobacteria bacterium]
MSSHLNLGRIDYLNCRPLYEILEQDRALENITLIHGHPADLNRALQDGSLDLSPSSSILLAAAPQTDFFILPDLAITSRDEVRSVLLVSRRPPQQLEGGEIALTGHSLTSVFLLKIILFHFYRLNPKTITFGTHEFSAGSPHESFLVIGDRALSLYHHPPAGYQIYDLGRLWRRFTDLPFVYALWIGRSAALEQKRAAIARLHCKLLEIMDRLPERLNALAETTLKRKNLGNELSKKQLLDYWQKAICYRLDEKALAGLDCFFSHARELGLIEKIPQLCFFPDAFRK